GVNVDDAVFRLAERVILQERGDAIGVDLFCGLSVGVEVGLTGSAVGVERRILSPGRIGVALGPFGGIAAGVVQFDLLGEGGLDAVFGFDAIVVAHSVGAGARQVGQRTIAVVGLDASGKVRISGRFDCLAAAIDVVRVGGRIAEAVGEAGLAAGIVKA